MSRKRILIVDDSVVIRRVLREALTTEDGIDVAGVAANGQIALAMVEQVNPDLITLDIEMPVMDGLETLRQLRDRYPAIPVIMFSTLTQRGALATLDALALGARDYVTKPEGNTVAASIDRIRAELVPKVKALCITRLVSTAAARVTTPVPHVPRVSHRPNRVPIEVVAIGTSTGGPNALAKVIPCIPADFPVPVVVVQHMPPTFTRFFAQRLASAAQVPVRECSGQEVLAPGEVWIAPGDFHMIVRRESVRMRLATTKQAAENSCRPSVDVLFRSVAEMYGPAVLAVVMTGMGQDGLRGSEMIREAGGQIMVQDEATSVVWGMPGFVAQAGLADAVLPLDQIGPELVRKVVQSQLSQVSAGL
ncbi:MAG TPA: chemotaxis response regulator protein-glutamate methylesterase [Terriglobales bacterium]|nr:chemotaxis response regulator protein-glutamate methylesterase [Terriglobales bacterium]